MRYSLISLAFFFGAGQAFAGPTVPGPSPESDLGLASIVMVAAAAFLAYGRRRR
jgi:hypothetical protein